MTTKQKPLILIVEDDQGLRRQLRWAFDDTEVVEAGDRNSAIRAVDRHRPAVVLLDLGLPPDADGPSEGLAAIREIVSAAPDAKVIVMTGQTERESAVEAVSAGAYDFYEKPLEINELRLMVRRALVLYGLESENRRLSKRVGRTPLPGLITTSSVMLKLCEEIRGYAPSDLTLMLLGESGTGKEVIARATHELSNRSSGPFVAINCAAIPEHLLESELFGHERGAFTGAVGTIVGKVELANKGTLLLDEIGDLPIRLQAKFLRFLQERVIERIGGRKTIAIDVRIISATNKDPRQLIAAGNLREDLYYRLSETIVKIPPLRERPGDVVAIAQHFLEEASRKHSKVVRSFGNEALATMSGYLWPGNVRELENCINRAVVRCRGTAISMEDLDLGDVHLPSDPVTLKEARERAERAAVTNSMILAKGNISRAARILKTSRPTLYQMLQKYELEY